MNNGTLSRGESGTGDLDGDSPSEETISQKNLEPRETIARTSISLKNNDNISLGTSYLGLLAQSSNALDRNHSFSEQHPNLEQKYKFLEQKYGHLISTNLARLKMAYGYLTPIVDEVLTHATAYSHREFFHLLQTRAPICSISYNQYVRAFQASQLLDKVDSELKKNNILPALQDEVVVNTVATSIKQDDLMRTISKMADRIYIDKKLMKQLVDLHQLIADTIKKLRANLEQVSEGFDLRPSEDEINLDAQKLLSSCDKLLLREQIAESFIIIAHDPQKGPDYAYWKTTLEENQVNKSEVVQYSKSEQRKSIIPYEGVTASESTIAEKRANSLLVSAPERSELLPSSLQEKDLSVNESEIENFETKNQKPKAKDQGNIEDHDMEPKRSLLDNVTSDQNNSLEELTKKQANVRVESAPRKKFSKSFGRSKKECSKVKDSYIMHKEEKPMKVSMKESKTKYPFMLRNFLKREPPEKLKIEGHSTAESIRPSPDKSGVYKITRQELEEYIENKPAFTVGADPNYKVGSDDQIGTAAVVLPSPSDVVSDGKLRTKDRKMEEEEKLVSISKFSADDIEQQTKIIKIGPDDFGICACENMPEFSVTKAKSKKPKVNDIEKDEDRPVKEGQRKWTEEDKEKTKGQLVSQEEAKRQRAKEFPITEEEVVTKKKVQTSKRTQTSLAKGKAESDNKNCKAEGIESSETELNSLKRMFCEIGVAIERTKTGHSTKFIPAKPSSDLCDDLKRAQEIQEQVFKCLNKMQKMKALLKNMNNSELSANSCSSNCGCDRKYLHVHVKVQEIALVIKLNESNLRVVNGHDSNAKQTQVERNLVCKCRNKNCLCKPPGWNLHPTSAVKPSTHNNKVIEMKHNNTETVVMDLELYPVPSEWHEDTYPDHEFDLYEMAESRMSLPYVVHRRSLPNINTCDSMIISTDEMRRRMRSSLIEHPRIRIERQLKQLGMEALLQASTPAKCCRIAVINEEPPDNVPFCASISSLPLTASDLQLISESVKQECMRLYLLQQYQTSVFEYYTNFQENLASNLDYFVPRRRVYEVRYFELFKSSSNVQEQHFSHHQHRQNGHRHQHCSDQQGNSRTHDKECGPSHPNVHHSRSARRTSRGFLSELFRKIIFYNTADSDDADVNQNRECYGSHHVRKKVETRSKMRNKRCQTHLTNKKDDDECECKCKKSLDQNSMTDEQILSMPWRMERQNLCKNLDPKPNKEKRGKEELRSIGDINDTSSLSPSNYAETLSAIYQLDSFGKLKPKARFKNESISKCMTREKITKTPSCNSNNLGTIYEGDEKDQRKSKNHESFYEFLRSPDISASFQKFITSESCMEAFEKNNIDAERFWTMYFEARKAQRKTKASQKYSSVTSTETGIISNPILRIQSKSLTCITYHKETNNKAVSSKIRRKPKTAWPCSASLSDLSSETITTEPGTSTKDHLKIGFSTLEHKDRKAKTHGHDIKRVPSLTQANKAKIFFTEIGDESVTIRSQATTDSMQSLQVLASRNGPGYITVLHPICGCPEVSIFIPCYCEDDGYVKRTPLSAKKVEKLMSARDGRHIVLPCDCRIPKGYTHRKSGVGKRK